ncbi:GNAT family N-acetyltransferase [Tropicibacter sp. R16_0]|uniref:GNAT family N-acetyltransferase n=1 Tax=Tropicibacter sp. R16_0 TaxID=2821102 RepID=UPI001ADC9354|nr:GNAT family N-acetyltransferase [Tropicibacter sp. R16_0]MBO9452848.1 GNAT family N-acetyltransferase [Tropicibacter sp. R16_0]
MKIRAATSDDLSAIRDIHVQSWRSSYAGMLPNDFLEAPLHAAMTDRWAQMPGDDVLLLVAEEDGLLGFACIRCDDVDGPLLDNLHVAGAVQGRGVGLHLMQALAKRLTGMGKTTLWLEVLEANTAARRFYDRLGGVEGPVFQDDLFGNPVPARKVIWDGFEKIFAPGEKS